MINKNKKSFLQKGSVAKRLALMTLFGVGFVLPGLNNMALANYGGYVGKVKAVGAASGYEMLTGCNTAGTPQNFLFSDLTTNAGNPYWAKNKTDTYGGNYVVLTGTDGTNYTFKVMAYSSANATSGTVTLWSYRNNTAAGQPFGTTTFGGNSTYSTSTLRQKFMTGSVADILSNYTGAMVPYTASGSAATETVNGTAANDDIIWAPSSSEVKDGGMWGLSGNTQRGDGYNAWLRSRDLAFYAYTVSYSGTIESEGVGAGTLLTFIRVRPALQLKIASYNFAFTSNAASITANTMTAGSSGSYEYEVDSSKTATFTPTNGVTLDNLSITVSAGNGGLGSVAGLLTANTGAAWNNISGAITHMATGTTFNLTNAGTGNNILRIFGVDTTNKKVTNLAANCITNLSKGTDGKIHMKVSSAINNGVGITLKGGAVVDLAGDASNAITQESGDKGKLNLGSYTYSGTIKTAGTLTIEGTGTLAGTVSDNSTAGKIVIDGTIRADADKFTQTGGLEVKDNTDVLTFTGANKTLGQTVSGAGKVVIDGTISADADKFTQTGGLEVKDNDDVLTLTGGTLSKDVINNGTIITTGDVTISSKLTDGTLQVTGGTTKYTNANVIGAKTVIKSGAKLDPAANRLNADTTVESGGELYISTGTLGVDIKGTGTTYIKDLDNSSTAQTITVNSDRSIAGTLNGSGNTVDMTGDTALKTFTIGTLAGTTNLKIDVDMSSFTADKLAVTNIGGATVNLSTINITKDITPTTLELPKTEDNKITYVTATNGTATYNVNGSVDGSIILTNNYKYTFTKGTTGGTLNYKVEATDLTFKKFAEGTLPDYTTDPATLSLTADLANTGTGSNAITVGTDQSNTSITVNLNGHNFKSTADSTVTIESGKTFNLNGGSTTAGTTDSNTKFSVVGTLAISGKTKVAGTISGAGTVTNIGELTIEDASKIQVTGTNGFENTGTINLGGTTASTLGGKITGGVLNITGDVKTIGTNLVAGTGDTLVVSDAKTLTITSGNLARNITGTTGTTKFIGTSESTATIANKLVVDGGTLTINANNIDGTGNTVASGTLKLNGGQLDNAVTGTGTTEIIADTTLNANLGTAITVAATKKLTSSANNIGGAVTNNGTVDLTAGTLGKIITGGTLNINDDVSSVADNIAGATNNVVAGKTLNLTAGTLSKDVTNNGTVKTNGNVTISGKLNGSTGGKLVVESGKLIYTNTTAGSITNNVEIKAGAVMDPNAGVFANGTTVTNYGTLEITGGTLTATIDGKGGDNLVMNGRMEIGASGSVKQAANSNITVAASTIESSAPIVTEAMFRGVNANDDLVVDHDNSKLTLTGAVVPGKYYVLVAGTAVTTADISESTLWNITNIITPDVADAKLEYYTDTVNGIIALKIISAVIPESVSLEEKNTSGLAAVQQGALSVAKEFNDEVEKHLGLVSRPPVKEKDKAKIRNVDSTAKDDYKVEVVEQGKVADVMPVQVVEKDEYDKEVWASYINTKETTEGMNLGAGLKGDNTAQYNGTVVGVDFYTSKKAIAGMALSYITGDINSYSGETSTRNKSKYYGVSFYDRVTNGNTALIYDVGFIRGDNDISQFYTGKETTSDVKTNTYTAGARWEAAIETGRSKIVPFAAFRYMRVNNGDYTNSHGTKFETKNQNLYIPKVGIAWTGDFIMPKSVWTWRPSVEAGYVWNLGDRTADSNVLMGTRPAAIEYDTVDKSSYYAKAGMEFIHKNFTAGLFYRYLKGDKVRNNKWNINVSWAF